MIVINFIEQDIKEIQDLVVKLSSIDIQNGRSYDELLLFLVALRDTLQLYWQIKQDSIYHQWPEDSDVELIEFSEAYFFIMSLVGRCLNSVRNRQLIKGFVQLKCIITSHFFSQLKQEKCYLAQRLPQKFSAVELRQIAKVYEQYKQKPHDVILYIESDNPIV